MNRKLLIKSLLLLLSIVIAAVMFPACYEAKNEVIGPGEGTQIKNLADGIYQNEEKNTVKVKWETAAKEYALEFISKDETTPARGRGAPLHEAYWLLQIYNPEETPPYSLFFITVEKDTVVAHTAQDAKVEMQLAVKNGAAASEEEFRKGELASAKPAAMRAFMKALAASGTLKPEVKYRYMGEK